MALFLSHHFTRFFVLCQENVDYLNVVTNDGSKWDDYVPAADSLPFPPALGWPMYEVLLAGRVCPIGELYAVEKHMQGRRGGVSL